MVLEALLTAREAEKSPLIMFLVGFLVSSIALWLAYYIFPQSSSAWFLFLTAIALEPLLLKIFYREEQEDIDSNASLFQRHSDVILIYLFLFFGMIVSFSFWYTILPQGTIEVMFKDQIIEVARIQGLRSTLLGALIGASGYAVVKASGMAVGKGTLLKVILVNNLRLLFLFVSFAFIFGAGAILLLTWNAAVVGVAIGNLAKGTIVATAHLFEKTAVYFKALPFSFMSFFVHGIFEVLGYFVGAIAGGILSVAIVRKHYEKPFFKKVILDIILLMSFAIILIIVGAFIEVYITPIL